MELFSFKENEVITSWYHDKPQEKGLEIIQKEEFSAFSLRGNDAVSFSRDGSDPNINSADMANQFMVFQFSSAPDGPSILESSQVNPSVDGTSEEPDVLMALEMLSFNLGTNEAVDKDTKATIRINIGKDSSSRDKNFDTAFWSIAAGLDLFNGKDRTPAKDLKADFKKAFNNRPIEIPGGLSQMTFEVVKHKEPAWWQKIFKFLESDTGKNLVSTIGFPAITSQAITMLDQLMNRLQDNNPEVLFKSRPLRLALTQQAKHDFTQGITRIKMGCLNPGFCVLARGKDFQKLLDADPIYYPTYGKLVPASVNQAQLLSGKYDDPLKDATYAIFKVGMKKTKLDPTFNYS
ncbi:hypothetical protein SIO70_00645 [Chitinophaga sancti]|uniref:hypothetical protein n=1 Tax=Chitinophaga sancti TaxID=1004 RepID=UPI002A755101|nr:hypothetical protein [Chitinophaga sancti]WPQ63369.1 hypothetical protein SIO70_00645 [Chitinophaga sancti]